MNMLNWRDCHQCGWIGSAEDTKTVHQQYGPPVEVCPECKTDDMQWITKEEATVKLAEYED